MSHLANRALITIPRAHRFGLIERKGFKDAVMHKLNSGEPTGGSPGHELFLLSFLPPFIIANSLHV